ncbi:MAG: DAK2 domain-containing protein [Dehalococcoidales bacterium]|nr:DAK2 domain-containing protein [Dehalococcoidales bacterium]
MKQVEKVDGQVLREMFAAATTWLEKNASEIDALNVFPVPDGDTGTNMLLTMRSGIEEAYRAPDKSASAIAEAMAKGALMGARGNSGVILSQIWHGFAIGVADKENVNGKDMAAALSQASKTAYKGLSNPVEGTILTVVKDAAKAVHSSNNDDTMVKVVEKALEAAGESVANTPKLLPVLLEAGVVDAGGQGFYTILEGMSNYLKGESEQMQFRKPWIITSSMPTPVRKTQANTVPEVPYGYCTEFMVKGSKLQPDKIRSKLEKKGQSLIVVGDDTTVRVHIHTLDPGQIIHNMTSKGTIHQVSIRNMDEQYQDFLEMQKERAPTLDMDIVAVVSGDGLSNVFKSLGAAEIVRGGQTMNPSTKELLQAVESVQADKVILLPNNKNIVLTAEQVHSLTKKEVKVIPTKSIPQGIAALLAFDFEADFESNIKLMDEARQGVKTIEITRSVRSTKLGGFKIRKKQPIALLDDELVSVADTPLEVLSKVMSKLGLDKAEIVTIYYGADSETAEAEEMAAGIRENYSHLQIDVVQGGQPHYDYIVSIE